MTTHNEAAKIIEDYNDLISRAAAIADGPPYWMRCNYEYEFARLALIKGGGVAELSWPEAESGYYSSCSIETQRVEFPADLLRMDMDAIEAWKAHERIKYNAEQQAKLTAAAIEQKKNQEIAERRALAALKAKYEK